MSDDFGVFRGIMWALLVEACAVAFGLAGWIVYRTGTASICLILALIALCLYAVVRELQKQKPRNSRRHFGL